MESELRLISFLLGNKLCFLLNPRTERVVSEPRASNRKMVEYECLVGGHVEKVRTASMGMRSVG